MPKATHYSLKQLLDLVTAGADFLKTCQGALEASMETKVSARESVPAVSKSEPVRGRKKEARAIEVVSSTVHYRPPRLLTTKCGRKNPSSLSTTNRPERVTCTKCTALMKAH